MAAVIYGDCWPSSVGRRGKPLLTNITCPGTHKREACQDSGPIEQADRETSKNIKLVKLQTTAQVT